MSWISAHVIILLLFTFFAAVQVRLANGSNEREGRVEVFYNGAWGTVCDDDFDIRDAHVICRMMGFPGALSVQGEGGRFSAGNESQQIVLDDLFCSGHEASIADCSFRRWGTSNCYHEEDAGVICQKKRKYCLLTLKEYSKAYGKPETFHETNQTLNWVDLN